MPLRSEEMMPAARKLRGPRARIAICECQPVTAIGLAALIRMRDGLELAGEAVALDGLDELIREATPDVVLIDKANGADAVAAWIGGRGHGVRAIVWGASMTDAEALRYLHAGAHGVLRKSDPPAMLLDGLETVAAGGRWMTGSAAATGRRAVRGSRDELTSREREVLEQVELGRKNREIARELGIQPGTVKIHLKHIFEKTGVRGRYGLALSALRQREPVPAAPPY